MKKVLEILGSEINNVSNKLLCHKNIPEFFINKKMNKYLSQYGLFLISFIFNEKSNVIIIQIQNMYNNVKNIFYEDSILAKLNENIKVHEACPINKTKKILIIGNFIITCDQFFELSPYYDIFLNLFLPGEDKEKDLILCSFKVQKGFEFNFIYNFMVVLSILEKIALSNYTYKDNYLFHKKNIEINKNRIHKYKVQEKIFYYGYESKDNF